MRLTLLYFFLLAFKAATAITLQDNSASQRLDTVRVNQLNRISTSLRETDHDSALHYADEAYAAAREADYQKGKAVALGNMGWIYYRKADYVKALQLSIESMKIAEQLGDKAEMARAMNSIASVSFEQNQFNKSLQEFKRALALGTESGEGKVISRTLNNIAYLFLSVNNQVDSAEVYARRAIAFTERSNDSYLTAFGLRTLGDIHAQRGQLKEALGMYQRSINLSDAGLNNSLKASTLHRVAKTYLLLGDRARAITLLKQNAEQAKRLGYLEELERTYKLLSQVYQEDGRIAEALDYLNKYTAVHDTIFTNQSSRQIALLQNQFDLDMKQAQIELLTKEADLKQEEIASQRMQLYAMILGASCVLLLVVVILGAYQKVKRTNGELQRQKEELARKNLEIHEKSVELSSLVNTKDKLFSIIGHDFRSPLHSLKGMLDLVSKKTITPQEFDRYSGDLKKKIDTVYDNLDNILNWSVSQLQGIKARPVPLSPGQLVAEVLDLHSEIARVKKVYLSNDISETMEVYADKDQVRLVIRNLVSNALKFTATGGYVRIWGQSRGQRATIYVQDSGVGIAPADLGKLFVKESLWSATGTNNEKGLGLGLLLCKEFIESNNGSMEVRSEPGVGSTVSFSLPLAEGLQAPRYFESLSEN
jgi:two-component system sensor histidine kinase/response regulator